MITGIDVLRKIQETAELDSVEAVRIKPFCETAAGSINERTRQDADETDIRLVLAAAATAYYEYLLMKNASDGIIDSFKAGDVTVSKDSAAVLAAAENYKKAALTGACSLLTDTDFIFKTM